MQGRTTIVITHRLANVIHCDRIAYLESGRICEEGTHAELMEPKESYLQLRHKNTCSQYSKHLRWI